MNGDMDFVNQQIIKSGETLEYLLDKMIGKLESILILRSMGNNPQINDQGRIEEGIKKLLGDLIRLERLGRNFVNRINELVRIKATMKGRVRRSLRHN